MIFLYPFMMLWMHFLVDHNLRFHDRACFYWIDESNMIIYLKLDDLWMLDVLAA